MSFAAAIAVFADTAENLRLHPGGGGPIDILSRAVIDRLVPKAQPYPFVSGAVIRIEDGGRMDMANQQPLNVLFGFVFQRQQADGGDALLAALN